MTEYRGTTLVECPRVKSYVAELGPCPTDEKHAGFMSKIIYSSIWYLFRQRRQRWKR